MNKRIILGVVALAIVGGALYFWTSRNVPQGTLIAFRAEKPQFIATGKYLGKVEVWAVPTGSAVTSRDWQKIGNMNKVGVDESELETWTLSIPETAILVQEIVAKAFDQKGRDAGTVSLPQKGPTDIYEFLWGGGEEVVLPLKIGEKAVYKDMTIELLAVESDTRCPRDAQCVSAGDVSVRVNLESSVTNEKRTASLSMSKNPYQFGPYYVEVTRVMPDQLSGKTIANSDYTITFTLGTDVKG